jgi:hypothetical protein
MIKPIRERVGFLLFEVCEHEQAPIAFSNRGLRNQHTEPLADY